MEYKDLITRIKSVRNYKKDTVSPEVIQKLKSFWQDRKSLKTGTKFTTSLRMQPVITS